MAVVFGLTAAVFIGLSDLGGRRVVLASSPATAATASNVIGMAAATLITIVLGGIFTSPDAVRGLVSGLGLGAGIIFYYGALPRIGATIAAPILGTAVSVLPYTYAVITGVVPSTLALIGAGLALAGIIVISAGADNLKATFDATGIGLAVASGLAYAAGIIAVIDVSADAGTWPAVFQKLSGIVLAVGFCKIRHQPVVPPPGTRRDATFSGIAAGVASCAYVLGLSVDPTPAIVTATMFPAFSVAVGRFYFGDTISRRQFAGIVCSLVGVAAVALS